MKQIPLSQGLFADVDDNLFESLNQHKWSAYKNNKSYYACRVEIVNGKRKTILMHREIVGAKENQLCDHKDGNGLNNTIKNLRIASRSQNGANRSSYGSSKYLGVHWDKSHNRWVSTLQFNKKKYFIGSFLNEEEAAIAYNNAAIEKHGEFARVNKI